MLFRIGLLVIIIVALYALFDAPLFKIARFAGFNVPASTESRQAAYGLRVAIDLDARRDGRRVAVLLDDWIYCYPITGDAFVVPTGYETDFASIPKFARGAINPFGNHAEAAVIHDWLYAVGENDGRLKADEIFRFAMKEQGVNIIKRNIMFQAVRLGGETPFGADDEWRFRSPRTLARLPEPPYQKPTNATIDNIDCSFLDRESDRILRLFEENFLTD